MQFQKTHYVGLLAGLTVAAVVVSIAVLLVGFRARELRHAQLEMSSITEMLVEQTQQNIETTDIALRGIQERLNTTYESQVDLASLPIHLLLADRLSGLRHLRAIFIADAQGAILSTSREFPAPKMSVADRAYFRVMASDQSDRLFIDKPVRSRLDNNWTLNFSRKLTDHNGKFRGVIVAVMGVSQLEELLSLINLDYPRPIGIYLTDGTLIASSPHREKAIGGLAPELQNETLPKTGNSIRSIQAPAADAATLNLSVGRLANYPLLVSVAEVEDMALRSWREIAEPIVAGGTLVCIFTTIVAMMLAARIASQEALARALGVATGLYRHTVDAVMDAIVAIDESRNIVLFNPAAEKMFGFQARDVLGKSYDMLLPESRRAMHAKHVAQFAEHQTGSRTMAPQMEITGRHADGHEFPIESTVSRSVIGGHLQMTAVLRDVTQRRRNEVELLSLNTELRRLSNSLQSVREQERIRLSRELHDELGQQLTGLKLSLSWLTNRIRDGRTPTVESVEEMRQQLEDGISSVRRISTELRPVMLDELGFGEAIAWQCSEFRKRSKIDIVLNTPAAKDVKDAEVATALFRIVQESLTNVARHSKATRVTIDLRTEGDITVLTICDVGQGFQTQPKSGGIGLVSMRERAIAIGADFSVASIPGAGTTIELSLRRALAPADGQPL